jgi:rRNA-processing protein FCF1
LSHEPKNSFIVDANVLIDYSESDLQVLSLFSQHIGQVYVGRSTFEKVKKLRESQAKKYHLKMETPSAQILAASSKKRVSLAYDDCETMLLAKANGWTCITNDKPLRRECAAESVPCLWGLELMKPLVENGVIKPSKALTVAKSIQTANPGFISDQIISRFKEEVEKINKDIEKKS